MLPNSSLGLNEAGDYRYLRCQFYLICILQNHEILDHEYYCHSRTYILERLSHAALELKKML